MDDEEGYEQEPPSWPFKPIGLLVELSKIPMGLCYALGVFLQTLYCVFEGIHRDLVAHYNHKHNQDRFAQDVAMDLETLDTTEE